jgi:hypothetical protein
MLFLLFCSNKREAKLRFEVATDRACFAVSHLLRETLSATPPWHHKIDQVADLCAYSITQFHRACFTASHLLRETLGLTPPQT